MRPPGSALFAVVALFAAGAGAAPHKLGPWGEDPAVVPDYAPAEERRAPKLYDSTRIYKGLPARDAESLDDALLVCHAIFTGSWDFLGAPDVTLRFALGKQPAVKLWGPEDHYDFYVSIPRIHLRNGDRVEITAWDRDVTKVEYIGVGRGRYDGHLPLTVTGIGVRRSSVMSRRGWLLGCVLAVTLAALSAGRASAANWLVSNGVITPALGRPLAGNATLASINVVEPGVMYGDRLNQLDFRVSKILRFNNQRLNVGVDIFNLFNTNAVYAYFQTLNTATPATFLQPASLVSARFAKVSVQFDF